MAARAARLPAMRRGAFGASLALHGLIAAAAVLPFLRPEPTRPAAPGTLKVVWAPSAAPAGNETAEPVEPFDEAPPLAPDLTAFAPPPEPFPEPEALRVPEAAPMADGPAEAAPTPPPDPVPADIAEPLPLPPPAAPPAAAPPREAPRGPARAVVARPAPPRPAARAEATASSAPGGPSGLVEAAVPAAPPGPLLITAPRYRSPPSPPVYPPRAVEFGLTGTVLVRAHVAPDGSTGETRVWRSSGHALLDAAAIAAVRRWTFEPASVGGRRVEAWVEVPVHFRLN